MTFIYSIWLWLAWHECVFLSCGKKKLFTLFIFFFFSQFDVYFCWRAVKSWLFRFDIVFPVRDFFPLQMSLSSWKFVWFEWSKKTYYYNLKMKWNKSNKVLPHHEMDFCVWYIGRIVLSGKLREYFPSHRNVVYCVKLCGDCPVNHVGVLG